MPTDDKLIQQEEALSQAWDRAYAAYTQRLRERFGDKYLFVAKVLFHEPGPPCRGKRSSYHSHLRGECLLEAATANLRPAVEVLLGIKPTLH